MSPDEQRSAAVRAAGPVEHRRAGEVTSEPEQRQPAGQLAADRPPSARSRRRAESPTRASAACSSTGHAAERLAPCARCAVVVRVRDRDRTRAAALPHRLRPPRRPAAGIMSQSDVPRVRLDEQHPLADRERRREPDPGQPRLVLADVRGAPLEDVLRRRPALAVLRHPLPLVLADRALRRAGGRSGNQAPHVAQTGVTARSGRSCRRRTPRRARRRRSSPKDVSLSTFEPARGAAAPPHAGDAPDRPAAVVAEDVAARQARHRLARDRRTRR